MRKLFLSTALATAVALSGAAFAQTNGSTKTPSGTTGTMNHTTQPSGTTTSTRAAPSGSAMTSGEMSAKDLIGTNVKNNQGDTVGEVEDLLVDKDGRVTHAILSVGGFLGVGDKRVEVPLDEMQIQANGKQITYNVTKDQLKQQPEYKKR